ncbi:MAG: metallophosphoesterase [Clostridia bacterium]|nr:metallophosphoesterase [Clostridia bacterium]
MKYFVVSDIHDHFDLLKDVLDKNGFDINNKDHKLIVCGDAFVRGPQPGEVYEFLKLLNSKDKLIFVYGNHDLLLLKTINEGDYSKPNKDCECIKNMQKYGLNIDEVGKFIADVSVPYFETKDYIFVHGFIPTKGKTTYDPNWRDSSELKFYVTTKDGMKLSMYNKIYEPNKKIVFGHYSTARCHIMAKATEDDWNNKIYKDKKLVKNAPHTIFYGDTFIAIDGSCYESGLLNLLVIDD